MKVLTNIWHSCNIFNGLFAPSGFEIMDSEKEKRKHKRYVVEGIFGSMVSSENVTVINISLDGVQIKTDKRLIPGREYGLKISNEDVKLLLKGEVAWCVLGGSQQVKKGEQIPVYTAGMKFVAGQDDKLEDLLKFIDQSRIDKREQRLSGVRFMLKSQHEAGLESHYRIRQLSLSGMLVEAQEPIDVESSVNVQMNLENDMVEATCRVAYCDTDTEKDAVLIGLEFSDFQGEGGRILNAFVAELEEA